MGGTGASMKLIAFIVEGAINTGLKQRLREHDAGLAALHASGYEFTQEAYNELYNEMKLARSDAPAESALWQVITSAAIVRGWDENQQLEAYDDLIREYRGYAGYSFVEVPEIREVLEELKFGCVDNWGDVPQIVALTTGGEMALDALEQAKLAQLFDRVVSVDPASERLSDPRVFAGLIEQADPPPAQSICVGTSLSAGLSAAKLAGMDTLLLAGDEEDHYPPRGPWEQPSGLASDPAELGDVLMAWLNAPPRKRRKSRTLPAVTPSTSERSASSNAADAASEPRADQETREDPSSREDTTGPRNLFE